MGIRDDISDCDRCDARIIERGVGSLNPFTLTVPNNEPDVYEVVELALCEKCRAELLEWSKGEGVDRSDKVNMVGVSTLVRDLRRTSDYFDDIADRIEYTD